MGGVSALIGRLTIAHSVSVVQNYRCRPPPIFEKMGWDILLIIGMTHRSVCQHVRDGSHYGTKEIPSFPLLQRRSSDDGLFGKSFDDYWRGFGDLSGSHWLGLNAMSVLCNKVIERGAGEGVIMVVIRKY